MDDKVNDTNSKPDTIFSRFLNFLLDYPVLLIPLLIILMVIATVLGLGDLNFNQFLNDDGEPAIIIDEGAINKPLE